MCRGRASKWGFVSGCRRLRRSTIPTPPARSVVILRRRIHIAYKVDSVFKDIQASEVYRCGRLPPSHEDNLWRCSLGVESTRKGRYLQHPSRMRCVSLALHIVCGVNPAETRRKSADLRRTTRNLRTHGGNRISRVPHENLRR